jgi:putative flippase GtrA
MISKFVIVGCLGFVLQLLTLSALTSLAGWPWLPATAVAVEAAVLHNFVWHEWWTWGDRGFGGFAGFAGAHTFGRLVRFNVATGFISIVGNLVLMEILVEALGLPPLVGNAIAVGLLSVVNFIVSDRWVFTLPPSPTGFGVTGPPSPTGCGVTGPPSPTGFRLRAKGASARQVGAAGPPSPAGFRLRAKGASAGQVGAAGLVVLLLFSPVDATAGPSQATLRAWDAYVAQAEAQLDRAPRLVVRAGAHTTEGASTDAPGGTISDWRGAAFLPGITLDQLLHRLQHPGTPPPQEEVVSSRVISRSADGLRVSIRLVRRSIVTVSYDTEHEMTFRRRTPTLATARSVATRIEEISGDDHGFLWRLNSYWRYEERAGGVMVELRSLTLSRDVPSLLRPLASPLVRRVARESMVRTLEALRREYAPA